MISLMLHEVRVRRKMIFWWAIGLAAFGAMYTGFYPSVQKEFGDLDMSSIDLYKAMGVSGMATFEEYMQSTVLNILPLLVGAFGIVLGTGALAGEEGAGTLELLAALPISRLKLYTAKTLALLVTSIAVVIAVAVVGTGLFLILESDIDTTVTAMDLFGALLSLWLIAFVFLALGLFLGALLPSRGSAAAVTAAILVVTFFANNLAAMVGALERFQPLFPSHYYLGVAEILTGAAPWRDVTALLVMGIVPLALGALMFQRRDLMVGAWPWTRFMPAVVAAGAPGRGIRSRRVMVPLAVAALAICGCAAASTIALAASDSLRADVRDRLGIADVISESGALEIVPAAAVASEGGRVAYVPVWVGEEVSAGATLVVVAPDADSALAAAAQEVLDDAWALYDELAAGATTVVAARLRPAVERADAAATSADRAWRDAQGTTLNADQVAELEAHSDLSWASLRIAQARLALANERLSDAHLQYVDAAIAQAQSVLHGSLASVRTSIIAAPKDGSVAALLVRPGDVVTAGQTVAMIAGREPLIVSIRVSADDADRLSVGQLAEIDADGFDDPFDGEVQAVVDVAQVAAAGSAADLATVFGKADLAKLASAMGFTDPAAFEQLVASFAARAGEQGLNAGTGDASAATAGGAGGDNGDSGDGGNSEDESDLPFAVLVAVDDPDGVLESGATVDVRIELD